MNERRSTVEARINFQKNQKSRDPTSPCAYILVIPSIEVPLAETLGKLFTALAAHNLLIPF